LCLKVFKLKFLAMSNKLTNAFPRPDTVKLVAVTYNGRNSARIAYEEKMGDTTVSHGVADCFDVASIEVDDNSCLDGNSILSASGEYIVNRRTVDKAGLGRAK
jgi:hypothetical protein